MEKETEKSQSREKAIRRMYKLVYWLAGEMLKEEDLETKDEEDFKKLCETELEKQHMLVNTHGSNAEALRYYLKEARDAAEYLRNKENEVEEWQIAGINAMCDRCNTDKVIPYDLGVSIKGLLCMHITSLPLLIEAIHTQIELNDCDRRKEDEEVAKKRPMTTAELFDKINGILKEKGKLPDILDYGLATHSPVPITNYEFEIRNNLDYGGNEGIYLDLGIEYNEDGKKQRKGLGTYKTLGTDDEDMRIMAGLLADFIVEEYKYVNANLDDFTWEGADVSYVDESGKYHPGWSCRTMEAALKKKDEIIPQYPKVVVRDNATRKEKIYERGGETVNEQKDTETV